MANAKKLKVGFVFDDSLDSYDGVAQYVKTLGAWLSTQDCEVRYLVGQTKMDNWADGKVYSLAKNQKVSFNGNQARIPLPADKQNIKNILAKETFDVLHVQAPYSPFLAQRIINAANPSTAIIGTFHVAPGSNLSKWGGYLLRLLCRKSLKRFDLVLSVSSAAADYAKNVFGLQSEILPNVIDVSRFEQPVIVQQPAGILFFGRLVKRKGAKQLIEAFKILHKDNNQLKLIVAGDGPERNNLQNLTKKLKLNNAVTFMGFVNEEDKPKLLASAKIVCFPSTGGESFGIVLLEAMAAGARIVIGGDNPGYKTVLGEHSELLFDPKNTKSFAEQLALFLEDNKSVQDLHIWQQQDVKKYDVKLVGARLLELYNQAIANHKQNSHN